ncbi:MAG: hypothetical protein HON90_17910 [Halobacteriovoraceae bacterium]|jgi:tRNA threonylcarbamoyladenosine biosynthesis protein TsaE|nr:hypothetical protein [Halobacteriovoraceae bacterium]
MNLKKLRTWTKVFESDLSHIAYELKEMISTPAMIVLDGDLGAGKTTFSKIFIDDCETISPSYSILSETPSTLHGDFYRIKSREEIYYLELPMYLEDKKYFLIEWGKEHYAAIWREIPEDFESYLLKISINKKSLDGQNLSRNFALFKILEQ